MRHYIDTVYIDCEDDEIILVKKLEAILELLQANKERIVCIICNEDVATVHIQKGDKS